MMNKKEKNSKGSVAINTHQHLRGKGEDLRERIHNREETPNERRKIEKEEKKSRQVEEGNTHQEKFPTCVINYYFTVWTSPQRFILLIHFVI